MVEGEALGQVIQSEHLSYTGEGLATTMALLVCAWPSMQNLSGGATGPSRAVSHSRWVHSLEQQVTAAAGAKLSCEHR